MAEEPDVIREQIEETRESLTDKIEALEGQVKETIEGVTDVVDHTVDSVKSGIHEGVEAVRRTFDLSHQVRQRPWLTLGFAAAAGAAVGYLVGRSRTPGTTPLTHPAGPGTYLAPPPSPAAASTSHNGRHEPGVVDKVVESFRPELEQVKEIAIGLAMGLARDMIKRAVPPAVSDNVREVMDNTTRKVGGKPVAGEVLPPEQEGEVSASRM